MARFDENGGRIPTTLFECAAWHANILAICRKPQCRRVAIFNPHQLWWRFHRKGWDDHLSAVGDRLKCNACKSRAAVSTTKTRAPTVELPWPDEREWRRAIDRFRA